MLRWHSSFPSIPSWKAWPLLRAQCIEILCLSHVLRAQDTCKTRRYSISKCKHTYGCALRSFMSLLLRAGAEDFAFHSDGSLNLQAGKLWCLKAILTEFQQVVKAGSERGWCGKRKAGEWDFGHTLTRASQQSSESAALNAHLFWVPLKGCKSMHLLPVGEIRLFHSLNPDLPKQFLASYTSSLMHHTIYWFPNCQHSS